MTGIFYAFLGTLFTFSITALGAANVFFMKKEISDNVQCIFLGFAGGVMIAASVWSLLIPGIERAEQLRQISWLVVAGGFLLGVILLLVIDQAIRKKGNATRQGKEKKTVKRGTALLVLAITAHNIPEGMAVGLAFAMVGQNPSDASLLSGALALALGIGIQNYPEGAAVALPLLKEGMSRKRAFVLGSLSAAVEPVFGVLAAALAGLVLDLMPLLLALAAGTMVYVVVQELIPEAHLGEKEHIGTLGFIVGFVVMMILDVALG